MKRSFDISLSCAGLCLTWWIIGLAYLLACFETKASGFFTQQRVGKDGALFSIIKIRTMRSDSTIRTNVTTAHDPRITPLGKVFRKTKIDELPQLINVLLGHMSFVGPRPDVPGFADKLEGADRVVLTVRPGITGPATLKFRHEEDILSRRKNPEEYNRSIIYPEKVRLNREYIKQYSFGRDLQYIWQTIFGKNL